MSTWVKLADGRVWVDPRSQAQMVLEYVPDHLLWPAKNPAKRGLHQRHLLEWLAKRNVQPTLAELEGERARRRGREAT